MPNGRLLDAKALQAPPWSLTKRQSYRVLEAVGVRISPRRIVALPERVEGFFGGGDRVNDNGAGKDKAPDRAAVWSRA